jgi:hypothetical protein
MIKLSLRTTRGTADQGGRKSSQLEIILESTFPLVGNLDEAGCRKIYCRADPRDRIT